jgi:hypothetical protein
MKNSLLYIINIVLLLSVFNLKAQESTDSIVKPKVVHALRLGIDISKPAIALFNSDYSGLELVTDYRVKKNLYLAAEYGFETRTLDETNYKYKTNGSFYKIGFDYNVYENLIGMDNLIYVGMRYGHSSFSQELLSYSTGTQGQYWPLNSNNTPIKYDNLNASWLSGLIGLKVEVFPHLFIGSSFQINRLISQTAPNNFQNLFAPGYNRMGLNDLSVSFNYTISYLIPFSKKEKKQDE